VARALRIQYSGAFYHVTCRGNERRRIFLSDDDRRVFLGLLKDSLTTYRVNLFAYILMSNHFHLLIQTVEGNLAEFMRRFNVCYTGWFNRFHHRCGHLYQGRYKAFLIDADSYLLEVSRYLHLNSIRVKGLARGGFLYQWGQLRRYPWSSLPGYLSKDAVIDFVVYDLILSMVGGCFLYRDFILDGLRYGYNNPFREVKGGLILGDDDFVERVKVDYLKAGSFRDQPSYRDLKENWIKPEVVIDRVMNVLGINHGLLSKRYDAGLERGVLSELLYRYSGLGQKEIGVLLGGIDYSAVSKLRCRLYKKMMHNKHIAAQYSKAERQLKKLMSNVEI